MPVKTTESSLTHPHESQRKERHAGECVTHTPEQSQRGKWYTSLSIPAVTVHRRSCAREARG